MQHHLLDRHRLLAVGRELGDVLGHAARRVEHAVADEEPHGRRDDRLRAREDAVARVVGRVAEGLERDQPPLCATASWHDGSHRCPRRRRLDVLFVDGGQVFPQHQCLAVPCCQLVALFERAGGSLVFCATPTAAPS